ncbi:MAG: hypothetical protein KatS3mg011_0484 [Acidimicrobiia bacterium]|nr:MAG: hypothetical protein KatS3mg011_0484 [Acidimicrobiia bacterium]
MDRAGSGPGARRLLTRNKVLSGLIGLDSEEGGLQMRSCGSWFARSTGWWLVLLLLVSGCSGSVGGEDNVGDPSGWIGAVSWVIEADVVSHSGGGGVDELEVVVRDVVFARDDYYWLGRYPLPALEAGGTLKVELSGPTQGIDFTGETVILAVQAAGTPDELAAGVRRDGGLSHSVVMVFDNTWSLVEAGGGHYQVYREIWSRYVPHDGGSLIRLLDDARVQLAYDNEQVLAAEETDGGRPDRDRFENRPSTPGPLGEWRRERGFEPPTGGADGAGEDGLGDWLAVDPARRQLPLIVEDLPPGAEQAIGGDVLVPREAVVTLDDRAAATYPWVGLRFVGVGVLGPFRTHSDGPVPIDGIGGTVSPVQVVVWNSETIEDLADAIVIAEIPAGTWKPGTRLLLQISTNPDDSTTVAQQMVDQ